MRRVEVASISDQGIRVLANERELFMPYADFPWFKEQPVSSIVNVEEQSPGHYYWTDLDVDLAEEIIEHPGAISQNDG